MHKDTYILDDETRTQLENVETGKLIADLIKYTKTLQMQVVALRQEINALDQQKPYLDLHSDLYQPFDAEDYSALERLKDYIEPHFLELGDYDQDY